MEAGAALGDALRAVRDLLIPPAAPPPARSPPYDAVIQAAARAGFPAFYAAHPAAVRNAAALVFGLLLLGAVLTVRALVRAAAMAVAAATGGAAAVRALEAEEREEGTLPDNAFWRGTLARRREAEGGKSE